MPVHQEVTQLTTVTLSRVQQGWTDSTSACLAMGDLMKSCPGHDQEREDKRRQEEAARVAQLAAEKVPNV